MPRPSFGSITNFVGWRVVNILLIRCIDDFQEEILIVRISISVSPDVLNLLVDPLHLARGNTVGGMGNNALKVGVKKAAKPQKVLIPGCLADIHYV